ncbi:MAG TPA: O-antigen ligase family protein, partial [Burkholderiaceae bacterium]
MESVVTRPLTSRLPWGLRLDPGAIWIWVLAGALVLYLGIDGGGYDLVVRSHAAVVVWWVVLVGVAWGMLPAGRISKTAWIVLALLAGLVGWSALALTWSASPERSLEEVSRLACYLGVLVLAVMFYGDRRGALRHVVAAVACAVVVVVSLALLSRLRPGLFPGAQTTTAFLPGAHARLSWPLNYWNALAGLIALALPLLLALANSARTLLAQAASAAAIPLLALCGYLTFSRGGAIAAAVAVAAFLALTGDRIPKLATSLVCGIGSVALIAGAIHRHAVEQGQTGPVAAHQGATLIVAVILVCAGVALAQVGIGLAARHATPPRVLQISPARARVLLLAALCACLLGAIALGAPTRLTHAWHSFKQPNAAALHQQTLARFGSLSGNGRYTYWKTALDAMPGHWLKGWGPGTFQFVWLPHAPFDSYIRNAHSLYVETLTEVGVVGLLLLVAFLLALLGAGIRRVVTARFQVRTWAAAVTAACLAFIVSAAFDWIWQMPVLPVAVLLLVAAVLVDGEGRDRTGSSRPAASRS